LRTTTKRRRGGRRKFEGKYEQFPSLKMQRDSVGDKGDKKLA
jgi:hypothetical protein